jgi:transcriptional regulator with XRE-family HTH domain
MSFESVSSIGRNVARYRKLAGMSAAELAERAGHGLTRSVIANLESGRKSDVSVLQLFAISATLGVPPIRLLIDIERPFDQSPYPMPSPDLYRFFDVQSGLPGADVGHRNYEASAWFMGQPEFGGDAAMQNYREATSQWNAFRTFVNSSVSFRRLQQQLEGARVVSEGMGTDGDAVKAGVPSVEAAEAAVIEAARTHILAIQTARDLGVQLGVDESDIARILERLGLSLPPIGGMAAVSDG